MEGERVKSLITRMMVFQLTLILLIGLALLLFFDAKLAFAGFSGAIWLLPNITWQVGAEFTTDLNGGQTEKNLKKALSR